jgi:hypothetical protein
MSEEPQGHRIRSRKVTMIFGHLTSILRLGWGVRERQLVGCRRAYFEYSASLSSQDTGFLDM